MVAVVIVLSHQGQLGMGVDVVRVQFDGALERLLRAGAVKSRMRHPAKQIVLKHHSKHGVRLRRLCIQVRGTLGLLARGFSQPGREQGTGKLGGVVGRLRMILV